MRSSEAGLSPPSPDDCCVSSGLWAESARSFVQSSQRLPCPWCWVSAPAEVAVGTEPGTGRGAGLTASWRRGSSRDAPGAMWDRPGTFQDSGGPAATEYDGDEDTGRDSGRVDHRPGTGRGTLHPTGRKLTTWQIPPSRHRSSQRGRLETWGQWQGQRAGAWGPRGLDLRPPLTSAEDPGLLGTVRHQRPARRRDGQDERPRGRISQWPKRPPRAPWQREARSPGRMELVLTPCTAPQWGWGLVNQLSRRPSPALPSLSPEEA